MTTNKTLIHPDFLLKKLHQLGVLTANKSGQVLSAALLCSLQTFPYPSLPCINKDTAPHTQTPPRGSCVSFVLLNDIRPALRRRSAPPGNTFLTQCAPWQYLLDAQAWGSQAAIPYY